MTEVEYIETCSAYSEVVWLRKILVGLLDVEIDVTDILCDNQSCIKMIENLLFHDKSEHIEVYITSSDTWFIKELSSSSMFL